MPDLDDSFEPQDEAETFDETNREDDLGLTGDEAPDEPDVDADVYDVTTALGDADEDEDNGETADDLDDDDLTALDLDEEGDEDEDDSIDDDLEDDPDLNIDGETDHAVDLAAGRAAPVEPGIAYTGDIDAITNPRDDDVEKYESTRPLSDEQLADLGYLDGRNARTTP